MKPRFWETKRIAWAIYWKLLLLGLTLPGLAGALFGAVIGIFAALSGQPVEQFSTLIVAGSSTIGALTGFLVMVWVLWFTLGKNIGGWVLTLERRSSISE